MLANRRRARLYANMITFQIAGYLTEFTGGRVDITITRAADAIGASGTGLLAAVVFDAVAPGAATLTLSGTGTGPGSTSMGLQFRPVSITVQQ